MRAEVSESSHARNLWVGHPPVLTIEPTTERAAVAIGASYASYLPEMPLTDLRFQEKVFRVCPHEIAGGEKQVRLFDRFSHGKALFCADAERLFHKHVLPSFRRRRH